MERSCRVILANDTLALDPCLDSAMKNLALSKKVLTVLTVASKHSSLHTLFVVIVFVTECCFQANCEDLETVLYIDATKMGALSQKDINMIGDWADTILHRNPTRLGLTDEISATSELEPSTICHLLQGSCLLLIPPLLVDSASGGCLRTSFRCGCGLVFLSFLKHVFDRKLENKLVAMKVELRQCTLNMNVEELHKNREVPGAFPIQIGVVDATLPQKGTAHRKVRGAPDVEASVNVSHVFEKKGSVF